MVGEKGSDVAREVTNVLGLTGVLWACVGVYGVIFWANDRGGLLGLVGICCVPVVST